MGSSREEWQVLVRISAQIERKAVGPIDIGAAPPDLVDNQHPGGDVPNLALLAECRA